jgi:2-haloacid dehalogenase
MAAPKALFFDINETLLDMAEMKHGLAPLLGGNEDLVDLWFANLLHHSLVDIASNQFHDFIDIGAAVLVMVAHSKGFSVSEDEALKAIKGHITKLPAHEDVATALAKLQSLNVPLVALSNSSIEGLKAQLEFAGISECFTHVLSTEQINTYKPYPDVYRWACKEVGVEPKNAMMVAAHGWDVSGAKAIGMQTTFVNRPGKMMYPLGLEPDFNVKDLAELEQQIKKGA